MRKEIFVPIRHRRDGSVCLQKKHEFWSELFETVVTTLFIVIALILLGLAIVQSSSIHAQEPNALAAKSTMRVGRLKSAEIKVGQVGLEEVLTKSTTIPSLWPLQGRMSDAFGFRRNPFHRRSTEFHPGQDIAAPKGTSVSATADGVVVFAGSKKGYGRVVIVDHGNNISTRYAHLSLVETTVGAQIKRGEEVGLVGSTGRSTGFHLHYEVRIGEQPVNPKTYLPESTATDRRRSL